MYRLRWNLVFVGLLVIGLLPPDTAASEEPKKAAAEEKWKDLFDGKKLQPWEVVGNFLFRNHGEVTVKDGSLVLGQGRPGTAVRFTGDMPKMGYELSLQAKRIEGGDFFCGMTFPVGDAYLSLIVGGWGGSIVGLSSIDGEPAVENETCSYCDFENKKWYTIRVRVTRAKVEAWIDKEKVVDLATKGRKLTILFEPESVAPLGIAAWRTTAALRNIRIRKLGE